MKGLIFARSLDYQIMFTDEVTFSYSGENPNFTTEYKNQNSFKVNVWYFKSWSVFFP